MEFRSVKGFTLIELLVVIAIIGVLSSVVLASLNTARVRAADAQRLSSVKQIQSALELFYLDHGRYPAYADVGYYYNVTPYDGNECGYVNGWCGLETALAPYMSKLPRDTASILGGGARYVYKNSATYPDLYGLAVSLDGTNAAAQNDGGASPALFEVGPLVGYCKKYTGDNAVWFNWDYYNLCNGGN